MRAFNSPKQGLPHLHVTVEEQDKFPYHCLFLGAALHFQLCQMEIPDSEIDAL